MISLENIQKDFQEGNYLDVVISVDEALKNDSNNIDLLNLKGIALIQLNDFDKAKETLVKGINLDQKKEGIRQNLAKLYLTIGDYGNAVILFEELLKINPTNKQYFELITDCLVKLQNYQKAIYWADEYIKIFDDSNVIIKNAKAIALTGNGEYKESIQLLSEIIENNKDNFYALNNQGNNYRYLGKDDIAIELYDKALSITDDFYDPYNNLGVIYQALENYEKAEKNYRKCLDGDENHTDANYNLANLLEYLGREDEALIFFNKGGYRGRIKLPEVLFNIGRYDEFQKYIKSIKDRIPEDRRISAIANFASEQLDIKNPYPWCPDPLSFLYKNNINEELIKNEFNYINLIEETNDLNEEFEPKDMTTINGFQTTGNLFNLPGKNIKRLKTAISNEIEKYRNQFKKEYDFLINWPDKYFINGWRVRLKSEGSQDFHIHARAWCSGVFYIKIPDNIKNDEGAIEFGLYGFNYKMVKNETINVIHKPNIGDLVLFPSSLFHRTIPFVSDEERICIAFDIIPKS